MVTVGLLYPGHSAETTPGARGQARRVGEAASGHHLGRRGRAPGRRAARSRPRRSGSPRVPPSSRPPTGRGDVGLHVGQFRVRAGRRAHQASGVARRRRTRLVHLDRIRRRVKQLGIRRVAVAASYPEDVAQHFVRFLTGGRRRGGVDGQPRHHHRRRGRHARAGAGRGDGGGPPTTRTPRRSWCRTPRCTRWRLSTIWKPRSANPC